MQTRRRIIDAATRLFLDRGYVGTTIPALAADAGVSVETVYRSAGGKAELLAAAVQAALAGGAERAELPVEERPAIRRVIEEPDPRRQLRAYAATQPGVWGRSGPLLSVLAAAAGHDPALAALQDRLTAQRLDGLRRFAQLLHDRGALRSGLPADRAADLLWTICAQANYDSLVTRRGWTADEYRTWLGDTLISSLLEG
ncbi:TetR/AcrR family transcriptional regulator [Geodermatophilus sabuli]|uniref:TetR/AcrR family transcriptional regulator n=1 Tax=Geodermatophilus sabuli TaxID=1564158 RepID=A0A7K3W6W8_9ACTN|nr:TetR/AcrR family transcriptional regulator [Geodermatophilus sabuli]